MLISSRSSAPLSAPRTNPPVRLGGVTDADRFIPRAKTPPPPESTTSFHSMRNHLLTGDEYKNISERDTAKMLGFFTQKMQEQGFPWRLYSESSEGFQGRLTGETPIGDLEALKRLQANQSVVFQPMRNLQLDLSADSLGAVAAAGSLGGGGELASVARLAELTKNTRVSPGSQGFEVKNGEPVVVGSAADLKLLYQMYNADEKLDDKTDVAKSATQFSFFTQQRGDYGWRFYADSERNTAVRVISAFLPSALRGSALGAAVGAVVAAPIGFFAGSWHTVAYAAGVASAAFGAYSGINAARNASKGEPKNAVKALEHVVDGKPIMFQETQLRSLGVPIFGKLTWVSDHGAPSRLTSAADLDRLYYTRNQAVYAEPPAPKKPSSQVNIDNRQTIIHYHCGPEENITVGR